MENSAEPPPLSPARLHSLDAYRGIVMFFLMAGGFGIAAAAKKAGGPDAPAWLQTLAFHNSHPDWNSQFYILGFSLWDMIQPSFMFIVGVSMPWSYGKRAERGDSLVARARHAWIRALILVLLGVFLQSLRKPETNWIFTNVLSQIGLGYGFLFFLVGHSFRIQLSIGLGILVAYSGLLFLYPITPEENFAEVFDRWFLNLFPREKPFLKQGGHYATLNFVPALVTMLMGVMCGQLLRSQTISDREKLHRLLVAGACCLIAGLLAGLFLPIVKRIWTPSWTLFSGAYCIWLLALLYWIVDLAGWKRWTWPFVLVGLNPITAYFMSITMRRWVGDNWKTHLPDSWFFGATAPVLEACLLTLTFWLILSWMYRHRIFIRI